jgi:hypothetical protein
VQPGFGLDVVVTQDWNRHEPRSYRQATGPDGTAQTAYVSPPGNFEPFNSSRRALQRAVGYGWRHFEDVATQLQRLVETGHRRHSTDTPSLLARPLDRRRRCAPPFLGYLGAYQPVEKATLRPRPRRIGSHRPIALLVDRRDHVRSL